MPAFEHAHTPKQVREWDSNGTVFGYNKKLGHVAGEFGHNDFYGVVVAACQMKVKE
jgi:2-methylcitrate dehydratase